MLFIIHLPRQVLSSSLVGFQGDPWISAHIDVLRPTTQDVITLHEAMGMSISHLFFGKVAANKGGREEEEVEMPTFTDTLNKEADSPEFMSGGAKMPERQILPSGVEFKSLALHTPPPVQKPEDSFPHLHAQFRRLHGCIQSAASRLQDSSTNKERATKRVNILVRLIPRNPSFPLGMQNFV